MKTHLMFANPDLERLFRKLCDSKYEVGGYLFSTLMPVRGLNRRDIKRELDMRRSGNLYFITSWVVLPNEAEQPERQWNTSLKRPAMERMAEITGRSLGSVFQIHFHTHPGYNNSPSQGDILFWLEHCRILDSKSERQSEGVIVAGKSFSLKHYTVNLNKAQNRYALDSTPLISWRWARLRAYRKQVFGK